MFTGQDIAGRVQACYSQAAAWASIGETERTAQLLKQVLFHSFGVGYRKDYQLNNWIAWLKQIHKLEPEQAATRTIWFSQAILTLEDNTESKATWYAANKLLATTFSWSPCGAIHLFHWFNERGILFYEKAIVVLLDAALDAPSPPLSLIVSYLNELLTTEQRETGGKSGYFPPVCWERDREAQSLRREGDPFMERFLHCRSHPHSQSMSAVVPRVDTEYPQAD